MIRFSSASKLVTTCYENGNQRLLCTITHSLVGAFHRWGLLQLRGVLQTLRAHTTYRSNLFYSVGSRGLADFTISARTYYSACKRIVAPGVTPFSHLSHACQRAEGTSRANHRQASSAFRTQLIQRCLERVSRA